MTATEMEPYAGGQIDGYRAGMVMAPEDAKALDDKLRACMTAVLREGTDYGVIPGTGGEKALLKPGAEKLLQWFGLGFSNDRQEVERDEDGRKEGVNYRCTITRALPDGRVIPVATCDSYAGYDEDKFYKTAEQVQRKAEENERFFAQKDRRPPRPTRWQGLPEYRAPWHNLLMMAQKRAIVGAAKYATAASGLFGDDPDDTAAQDPGERPAARQQPPADDDGWPDGATAQPGNDGRPWYDDAIKEAAAFTTEAAGQKLFREAADAARDGLCTPGQAGHVQNAVTARIKARRKLAAARILEPLAEDDPWRDKILGGLDSDEEARAALAEVQQLLGAGQVDDSRAQLLGRAIIARFPKAAIAGESDG